MLRALPSGPHLETYAYRIEGVGLHFHSSPSTTKTQLGNPAWRDRVDALGKRPRAERTRAGWRECARLIPPIAYLISPSLFNQEVPYGHTVPRACGIRVGLHAALLACSRTALSACQRLR